MINNKHWCLFKSRDAFDELMRYMSGNTLIKPYHIEQGMMTADGMIKKEDGDCINAPARDKWYYIDSSTRLDSLHDIMRKDITKMMAQMNKTSKKHKRTYDRFSILKRYDYRCQLCGATAQDGAKLEIDHIIPKSKGGTNDEDNLWVLCKECNSSKKARYL